MNSLFSVDDEYNKKVLLRQVDNALSQQLCPYGFDGHLLEFLESKRKHLEDIIKRTAVMGESNSVLIMGPPGSGKSALLDCVVQDLLKISTVSENMSCVSLNGLIHTNDNLAFDDITKQLDLRPDADRTFGNASEKLRTILTTFKTKGRESRSVLFILDMFELFCTHKNQNLLYNLFNCVQMREVPLCIIGLTSHPDQLQALENRVCSRFSHQKISLFDELSFEAYCDAARRFLKLEGLVDPQFQSRWNAFTRRIPTVYKDFFKRQYTTSTCLRNLKQLLAQCAWMAEDPLEMVNAFDVEKAFYRFSPKDATAALIRGLSVLEVSILLALAHLTEIYDGDPVNFEIVFNEVARFFDKRLKRLVEKRVVMKAFEHLLELELVRKMAGDSSDCIRRYMPVRLLVPSDEVREAVKSYAKLPAPLRNWAESNLDG